MLSKLRSLSLRPARSARSARSAARLEEKTATKIAPSASSARNLTEDQKNRLENWRMSLTPSYRYINADELARLIKANPAGNGTEYAVVDVRDSDFAGGNIVGCLHYPSDEFMGHITEIVDKVKGVPKVVFHCALSQVRGPKAARRYVEARDMLLKDDAPKDQEVLVLREGFEGFHPRYRDDPVLVEKFNKFYHD